MVWRRISRSDDPIVSLAEAKRQTNTELFADDDSYLMGLCLVATRHLDLGEGVTRRPLLTQLWEYTAPSPICNAWLSRSQDFPPSTGFYLKHAPLQAVTKVEVMQGGAYVEIPPANYTTRPLEGGANWLRIKTGLSWPDADVDEAAFKVTARLGYGDNPSDVPADLRHAALMFIGHLYQNRESVSGFGSQLAPTPMGFDCLIAPHRFVEL